jgi:hypothetical protein
MEDVAPPAIVKMEALVPNDEEATTAAALEQCRADEEAKWSWTGLEDVVQLISIVAEHVAPLPSPPPLPLHAALQAAWDGHMVPPLCSTTRRQPRPPEVTEWVHLCV